MQQICAYWMKTWSSFINVPKNILTTNRIKTYWHGYYLLEILKIVVYLIGYLQCFDFHLFVSMFSFKMDSTVIKIVTFLFKCLCNFKINWCKHMDKNISLNRINICNINLICYCTSSIIFILIQYSPPTKG